MVIPFQETKLKLTRKHLALPLPLPMTRPRTWFQFDPAELIKSVVANDQEMRSHCGAATPSTNGFLSLIDDEDEDSILAESQPVGV
ncbi:hypothetical protein OPV22_000004 [Ensete ventricosum]|uniref:Uncharacterized protein n=1 Tax=Ensete ventricosum TaxID=4639 RepID=A0AAV8Q9H3_ENSVE|nr:hypothetical protein OPV22_035026 [Ensete ventricosum]KAJ8509570.1 hypothetical protein OPV22_000004 [Ensete ventricosum]